MFFCVFVKKIAKITSAKITKWFYKYPIVTQNYAKINQKYGCTLHKNLYVSFSAIQKNMKNTSLSITSLSIPGSALITHSLSRCPDVTLIC